MAYKVKFVKFSTAAVAAATGRESGATRESPVTSDLEVDPSIQCDEPFSVLNINVTSKQQHGERRYQGGVSQVDLSVLNLWINIY